MTLQIILGLILLPVLALNLLGPLLIWRVQKLPARVRFRPHEESGFLANRDPAYRQLDGEIRALGFGYLGSSYMRDTQTEANFSLYTHASDQSCAMVVTMVSRIKTITYVEFTQVYADGSLLSTSNVDMPSTYPRMALKVAVRFAEVADPRELYARFRSLRAGLRNSARAVPYSASEGFRMVEDFMDYESDLLVEMGYCFPQVDAEGRRALTLKGAYLLSWRSIFPGKGLKGWLDRQHAARLLAQATAQA
jgi:hypothetical protein